MKNYKTTLFGLAGAIWIAIQPILQTGHFDISKDWPNLVGAAISAGIGYAAKDFNVSDTTK